VTAGTPSAAGRRSAKRWVVLSLLALVVAWLVAPAVVPIYDGIGNPDEPYRWVKPPAGVTNSKKPPTTAKVDVPVRNGVSDARYANSAESGPQISLYLPSGAFAAPKSATSVTVTAQPLAPTGPAPSKGTIVSNVYRITATADGSNVDVVGTGSHAPTLQMRAPSAKQPGPVFEHLADGKWTQVSTLRVGNDIYQAQATEFGDWALVELASGAGSGGSGGGVNVGLLAAGIAVLVLAGVIAAIRRVRLRQVAR
jgi:hypothetical protein